MTKELEVLAIIPARGGSKGIPRKNIRIFAGHPLIAYSIAAGLQAETVTRVLVTTDDEEIAEIARQYGAETPFLRPAELAGDNTLDLPVFLHALAWLAEQENYLPEVVVHLRPTTPIRPPDLVDCAVRLLLEHPEADSVRGVTPAHQNPFKMWLMNGDGKLLRPLTTVPGVDESYNAPRQVLPTAFSHTGLMDVIRPATILEMNSMSGKVILPMLFDPVYSADLDTPDDWRRAEESILTCGRVMVWPEKPRRRMPEKIKLLVLGFDDVLAENLVRMNQDGREMMAAIRSDSYGINLLRQYGVETVVISNKDNPVFAAQYRKLNITCIQGEDDKLSALKKLLSRRNADPAGVVYCGKDINDLPCFPLVGWAVAVADAQPEVAHQADFVLRQPGGLAAVRELCECILRKKKSID